MRSVALAVILFFGAAAAGAQMTSPSAASGFYRADAGLSYHWVHSNTQPADCGCFNLNGGGISAAWLLPARWSAVAEVSSEIAHNGPGTGNSLTLVSYLGGARYQISAVGAQRSHPLLPFVQILAGASHAGGGIAGAGDGAYAFESRAGGGFDLPLTDRVALRLVQVDYDATTFSNGVNDHQNNVLIGAGVVFHLFRVQ
ncbi:MAG: hypothetical protein WB622_04835 [Acidobacteriaceae bacterium]